LESGKVEFWKTERSQDEVEADLGFAGPPIGGSEVPLRLVNVQDGILEFSEKNRKK
jgi:hypothetical protein